MGAPLCEIATPLSGGRVRLSRRRVQAPPCTAKVRVAWGPWCGYQRCLL